MSSTFPDPQVRRKVNVKGIKTFKPQRTKCDMLKLVRSLKPQPELKMPRAYRARARYEHPFLIIGAGHIGLRHVLCSAWVHNHDVAEAQGDVSNRDLQGLFLIQHNHPNFVIVDRRDKAVAG